MRSPRQKIRRRSKSRSFRLTTSSEVHCRSAAQIGSPRIRLNQRAEMRIRHRGSSSLHRPGAVARSEGERDRRIDNVRLTNSRSASSCSARGRHCQGRRAPLRANLAGVSTDHLGPFPIRDVDEVRIDRKISDSRAQARACTRATFCCGSGRSLADSDAPNRRRCRVEITTTITVSRAGTSIRPLTAESAPWFDFSNPSMVS